MTQKRSLARPYAQAAFMLARERGALKKWSQLLALAAAVARDETMQRLVSDPRLARADAAQQFLRVCGDALDAEAANFICLLADNRRLDLLPEIAALFEERRNEAEGWVETSVVSAFPLTEEQTRAIEQAMKRRFGRGIRLSVAVDRSLLGGVIIRAGDLVIDGSARGRLDQLASQLNH
jgi:F-type H+-transporting ATPase subunit delta